MNDAQLIDKLGGVTAVARLLGITPPSVSGWKAIPLDKKIRLAVIAEDLGLRAVPTNAITASRRFF
ncbi:TPA: hypothetical protein OXO28_003614 [Acinetobacter baumannii]|nr:hypothetical protein [Acinetobacter baumannii]